MRRLLWLTAIIVPLLACSTPPPEGAIPATEAAKHIGETKTVCGKVADAEFAQGTRDQPTILYLDQPSPNQVCCIVILGRDRDKFETPPDVAYWNKRICVTGEITTDQDRPKIVVSEPSQIQVQ